MPAQPDKAGLLQRLAGNSPQTSQNQVPHQVGSLPWLPTARVPAILHADSPTGQAPHRHPLQQRPQRARGESTKCGRRQARRRSYQQPAGHQRLARQTRFRLHGLARMGRPTPQIPDRQQFWWHQQPRPGQSPCQCARQSPWQRSDRLRALHGVLL